MSSSTVTRLEEQAAMIAAKRDPVKDEIGYFPSIFIQSCLPQNNPGTIQVWERRHQHSRITISPWFDWDGNPHYPYGVFPRLLLYWVTWQAMQTRKREILLGKSFEEFIRKFTVIKKNKSAHHYRELIIHQAMTLFGCHIVFERRQKNSHAWQHIDFAPKGEIEWNTNVLRNRLTPNSHLILGEAFFDEILRRPVPIDMRAIHGLKHSAMALDFYNWATYQTFLQCTKPEGKKKYSFTPWFELMYQLGSSYAITRQFKAKIPHVLEQVKAVYPELQANLLRDGIVVHASRPAVQSKEKRTNAIE